MIDLIKQHVKKMYSQRVGFQPYAPLDGKSVIESNQLVAFNKKSEAYLKAKLDDIKSTIARDIEFEKQ